MGWGSQVGGSSFWPPFEEQGLFEDKLITFARARYRKVIVY